MGLQRVRHNWATNTFLSLEMTSCPWECEYTVGQISCLWTLTNRVKVILIYVAVSLLFVYMLLFVSSLRMFRKSSVTELNQNTKNWQQGLSHDKMCIRCSTLITLGLIFFFFLFWILVKLQESQSQFSHFSLVSLIILKYSPISPNPTEIFIFTYTF